MRFESLPSGLLVPKREIKLPPIGIAGYIGWELKRDGKVIRDSGGLYHNLLVDQGMNRLTAVSLANLTASANLGTGAVAPVVADTTMGAEVGTARRGAALSVTSTYVAGSPDYWYRRYTYNFLEAYANGNLTEIGLFDSGGVMSIRQLLKDGTGTPTTITKTVLDQLLITFEIRVYLPQVDVASVVSISGVNYDVVTRVANSGDSGAWGNVLSDGLQTTMGAIALETDVLAVRSGAPGGAFTQSTDHTGTAYVSNSFYVETKEVWDTGFANYATGIGQIMTFFGGNGLFANVPLFQNQFTPKIPKTNVKKLTMYMRRSWARYP